jgi:ubiquinol-cytochrome c reductase cytochrome b subunit
MRIMITRIGDWFDHRLQLAAPVREIAEHPVPRNTASWWYVFGSAALTVFVLQILTGILLALIYVPSGGEAWSSLQALNHSVTLGWFIRAMHGWGSNFMVAIVLIHMVQVFLFGAHKFPRELTWIVGVFLLLMTLEWRSLGRYCASIRMRTGVWDRSFHRESRSRSRSSHCQVDARGSHHRRCDALPIFRFACLCDPGLLIAFVGLHLLLVIKLGINEWPMPGRVVKRATYVNDYHELTKKEGAPFVPYAVWKDMFFAAFIIVAVAACALYFGPFGPTGKPDPTIIQLFPNRITFSCGCMLCSRCSRPRSKHRHF